MSVENKLTILLEEYKLINEKIEQYLRNQFRMMNIAFAITGTFLGFAFLPKEEFADIRIQFLNYLPFFLLIILSFVGYHYQRTMGFHGYKKYLEEKLNEIAGEDLIFYNLKLGLSRMIFHNLLSFFILFSFCACYIFSVIIAYEHAPSRSFHIAHIISGIVFIIFCTPIIGSIRRSHQRAIKFNDNSKRRVVEVVDSEAKGSIKS